MPVLADTHVHLHGLHRPADLLAAAFRNFGALAGGIAAATLVLCLAERGGRHAFRDLAATGLPGRDPAVRPSTDREALLVTDGAAGDLLLVAGRQVVTEERLEVLALTVDADIPDGWPIERVVEAVLEAGGVPVLAWAPGKWFFSRGRVVRRMLRRFGPGRVAVGDTSLRPRTWPEPCLMGAARRAGHPFLAGSDPLPIAGDERKVATYGVRLDGELDPARPVASLRELLFAGGSPVGRRDATLEALGRLRRHRKERG